MFPGSMLKMFPCLSADPNHTERASMVRCDLHIASLISLSSVLHVGLSAETADADGEALIQQATSSSSESTCSHSQSCATGRLLNELRIDTPELFLKIVTKRNPLSAELRFIQACHSEYWAFVPAHTELREQARSALGEEQVTRKDQLCVWFTKQQQIELLMDVLRYERNLVVTPHLSDDGWSPQRVFSSSQ